MVIMFKEGRRARLSLPHSHPDGSTASCSRAGGTSRHRQRLRRSDAPEQPCDADVFVEILPVNPFAFANQFKPASLLVRTVQQSGEPARGTERLRPSIR